MSDLSGKRLLLLGGTNLTIEAIERAKKNDMYVIVADYNENTPAKSLANKSYNISTADIDRLVRLCQQEKIDGIFTNWTDSILSQCCAVCETLGYPYPFKKEQLDKWSNKASFKKMCIQYGVPVPKPYSWPFTENEIVTYPVIVKPVDSSGSRGITVCNNLDELERAVQYALSFSKCKEVLIEELLSQDEITVNYIIQDGYIMMSCIHDRYFNTEQCGVMKVPDIYIYPSKYTALYMEQVDALVKNMIKSEKIRNGSIFIQACVQDGKIYIYEAGMRLNGCKIYQIVDSEYGYNALDRELHFAVTGNMGTPLLVNIPHPQFKHLYATISFLARPGKIGEIHGLRKISTLPGVIGVTPWHFEKDTILPEMRGTLSQTMARITLRANTKEDLLHTIEAIYSAYQVLDSEGVPMLLTPHSLKDISEHIDLTACNLER